MPIIPQMVQKATERLEKFTGKVPPPQDWGAVVYQEAGHIVNYSHINDQTQPTWESISRIIAATRSYLIAVTSWSKREIPPTSIITEHNSQPLERIYQQIEALFARYGTSLAEYEVSNLQELIQKLTDKKESAKLMRLLNGEHQDQYKGIRNAYITYDDLQEFIYNFPREFRLPDPFKTILFALQVDEQLAFLQECSMPEEEKKELIKRFTSISDSIEKVMQPDEQTIRDQLVGKVKTNERYPKAYYQTMLYDRQLKDIFNQYPLLWEIVVLQKASRLNDFSIWANYYLQATQAVDQIRMITTDSTSSPTNH